MRRTLSTAYVLGSISHAAPPLTSRFGMAIRIETNAAYGNSRRRVRKAAGMRSSHEGASKGRTESRNWFRSQAPRAPRLAMAALETRFPAGCGNG